MKCNQVAAEYTDRLNGFVSTPVIKEGMISSWAQYTICFQNYEERERTIEHLKESKIPSVVYYKRPMHLQKAFEEYKCSGLAYPITEKICSRCLSLPMHGYLDVERVQYITDQIVSSIRK